MREKVSINLHTKVEILTLRMEGILSPSARLLYFDSELFGKQSFVHQVRESFLVEELQRFLHFVSTQLQISTSSLFLWMGGGWHCPFHRI